MTDDQDVSRDLRAPLTLLLGPLQELLDSPAAALAPGSRAVLEAARRNAVRLLQLLDARPAAAADRGAAAEGSLGTLTAALAHGFQAACDAAGLQLVVDCAPLPAHATVDLDAWEKIVVNLVAHAVTSTLAGTIEVRMRVHDGNARLVVTDTGPGIPPSQLRHVFERVDRVTPTGAGDGVAQVFGLPLIHDLVRRHRGSIDVQSIVGRGTSFTVLLPLQPTGDPPVAPPPRPVGAPPAHRVTPSEADAAGAPGRGHVVIAEDHDESREYPCVRSSRRRGSRSMPLATAMPRSPTACCARPTCSCPTC